jgi:hypothetical protein
LVFHFQQPSAGLIQPVMQALPVGPLIRNCCAGSVFVFQRGGAGLGERIQDGVQLGADGGGEFACQVPHAVAALFQLHIAAVLLQLVINGFGAVRIGSIDHV